MESSAATLDELRSALFAALATTTGLDPTDFAEPGTEVVAEIDRAGSGLASAYQLDRKLVVRCDPAIRDRVEGVVDTHAVATLDEFESAIGPLGEVMGRGRSLLLERSALPTPRGVAGLRRFDPDDAKDRAMVTRLVEVDPEGADWAAIDLEDLDRHMFGVEVDGEMIAYASEAAWETDGSFADIGVVTHPAHRRAGLGSTAVIALCHSIFDQGRVPLYRHDLVNEASATTARSIGFTPVYELTAVALGA